VTKGSATTGEAARRYAWLSIAAAVVTIGLKLGAYYLTGSVGLFSDAAESLVNLVAAVAALWALTLAMRPPDEEHAFGHNKAEYFSSGLESAHHHRGGLDRGYGVGTPPGPAAAAEPGAWPLRHAGGDGDQRQRCSRAAARRA
jgi:hypothetical protein